MSSGEPTTAVLSMVRGAWITMALRAGVVLGLFEVLGERLPLEEVARRTATDPPTLARLLRTLTDLGLVERTEGGDFRTTALGDCLREDHPGRLCDLVRMQATTPNIAAWHALDVAVRTGSGVYEQVNGRPPWEALAADPDAQRAFNSAMARRSVAQVQALLDANVLPDEGTVVDVGGGRGAMLAGVLRERPALTGVLVDQPPVAAEAAETFAAGGLAGRVRCVGADFFDTVPAGGDAYLISNVLHDWDDRDANRILRTVRAAMPAHGRLLVVEHVLGAPSRSPDELRDLHLVDLHMLVMFGARERDQSEYDELFTAAGFTPSRLHATHDWNVLESRPQ